MNIVICVKQVPDVENPILGDRERHILNMPKIPLITNPYDLSAVEWAVRQKATLPDTRVTVICIGNDKAEKTLRECLAMGADRAFLICDPAFENCDGQTIGFLLSKAVQQAKYDIVLCGVQSLDNNAGWVGAVIASKLKIPLLTRVTGIDLLNGQARIKRKLEKGKRQIAITRLPCLLTVEKELCQPQYLRIRSILEARTKRIERYSSKDLGLSVAEYDLTRSGKITQKWLVAKPRQKKIFIPDSKLSPMDRMKAIMSGGATKSNGNMLEGNASEVASKFIQFCEVSIKIKPQDS
jgi:electron transfer flavoprotein alpha/beta subunit